MLQLSSPLEGRKSSVSKKAASRSCAWGGCASVEACPKQRTTCRQGGWPKKVVQRGLTLRWCTLGLGRTRPCPQEGAPKEAVSGKVTLALVKVRTPSELIQKIPLDASPAVFLCFLFWQKLLSADWFQTKGGWVLFTGLSKRDWVPTHRTVTWVSRFEQILCNRCNSVLFFGRVGMYSLDHKLNFLYD